MRTCDSQISMRGTWSIFEQTYRDILKAGEGRKGEAPKEKEPKRRHCGRKNLTFTPRQSMYKCTTKGKSEAVTQVKHMLALATGTGGWTLVPTACILK